MNRHAAFFTSALLSVVAYPAFSQGVNCDGWVHNSAGIDATAVKEFWVNADLEIIKACTNIGLVFSRDDDSRTALLHNSRLRHDFPFPR
jgi:hypothetical protein